MTPETRKRAPRRLFVDIFARSDRAKGKEKVYEIFYGCTTPIRHAHLYPWMVENLKKREELEVVVLGEEDPGPVQPIQAPEPPPARPLPPARAREPEPPPARPLPPAPDADAAVAAAIVEADADEAIGEEVEDELASETGLAQPDEDEEEFTEGELAEIAARAAALRTIADGAALAAELGVEVAEGAKLKDIREAILAAVEEARPAAE